MSLFGQTQQQQQQQPQQQSGSLFGPPKPNSTGLFGTSTATSQPQTTGLFGGQSQQQPSGGLFGQSTQQGGGLFGQSNVSQTQPSGGLFGQQQQGAVGLFSQPQSQQQSSGTSFGTQQNNGGLFGQQSQPQQMGGSMFNQAQQQTGFSGSLLSASSMNQQQMQSQGPNPVLEKIQRVKNSWDPSHPDYAFRYYFFNHVGKERAAQYQKPPQEDLAAWEKAWSDRPNDSCVPVSANGFKDLDLRVKTQENQVQAFRKQLYEIQEKLNAIQNRHDLTTSIKLEDCRRRHMALARRALSLASKVQVLKNRGYALQPEEEVLKKRLEGLAKMVQDPAATGRMNEIWARMMVVQEKARVMEESLGKVEIVWDDNQLQTAGRLLQSNFAGLEHLTKEVTDIEKAFAQWQEAHQSSLKGL